MSLNQSSPVAALKRTINPFSKLKKFTNGQKPIAWSGYNMTVYLLLYKYPFSIYVKLLKKKQPKTAYIK